MKKMVYKYAVGEGPFKLEMPTGAQILSVHAQREVPQLWALVDPDAAKVTRRFFICGTGQPLEKSRSSLLLAHAFFFFLSQQKVLTS